MLTPLDPTISDASDAFLRRLGFGDEYLVELGASGKDDARERSLAWVSGIISARGRDRGKAVRDCGRLFPAMLPNGRAVIIARPCKDRACPRCMVARATKLGAMLRKACEFRTQLAHDSEGARVVRVGRRELVFVTLTQLKEHGEDAGGALGRILKAWARLSRTSSKKRNQLLRAMFVGGVRGIECVWSGRGKVVWSARKKGADIEEWKRTRRVSHTVKYSGWHAHLHCVFELREGVTLAQFSDELARVWEWASPGSDSKRGVDVQGLQPRSVGQVAKYVTKPFELPEEKARELFRAVHARQMLAGFGAWTSWRKWVPEDPNPYAGAVLCATSLHKLAHKMLKYEARGRGAFKPEALVFCEWHHCADTETTTRRVVEVVEVADFYDKLRDAAQLANFAAMKRWQEKAERADDAADIRRDREAR